MRHPMLAVFLLGALSVPVLAEDPVDDPDHGVARISLVSGDVAVRRGDSGEEIAAEPNAPLVARDHVFTDRGGRAEIQLDWANMIRLAPDSEVRLAFLGDRNFRVELVEGTITFRVLRDSDSDVEISTPTAAVRPKKKGTYRITVRDDFSTEITVRSGETDVFAGRDYSPLRSGQTLIVRGDPSNPERNFVSFLPRDDWDSWNESRDRDLERSDSYKYVSRDIYGADDLHGHGRWVHDSPYGWVWVPNVAVGWAPYRDGRWYHADHYGWTWISSDPWGWAPYHYGRWYHAPRYGWVWYPGAIGPRHYWRPALVSFFGWGASIGSVNIAFGFGNVGWVPLAPYEVYRPWYGRNATVVNVINNVNIINSYRNARYVGDHNGVTSVFAGDFGRRRVTVNNYIVANDRDLNRAGDVRGRVPFEASRDSRRFSDRQVVVNRDDGRRRNNDNRQFVASRPDTSRPAQPRQIDRQEPRNNDRVFVSQPRQVDRQDLRDNGNDRGFVNQPTAPRQPATDSDRLNRSDRANIGQRVAIAPAERPTPATSVGVATRREPARTRPPETMAAPSPAPSTRVFDRPAEVGRRSEQGGGSLNRAVSEAPRTQRDNPQSSRREAPAAQQRRQESRPSQPAGGNVNQSSRGQGRGRR